MNILTFDTSGNNLSTCLSTGKGLFEENMTAGLKHSENLLPSVERLMSLAEIVPSDLDLIVCSRGPGSFTGLRIGMATAKGISSGSAAPLVSVNCLDAYAYGLDFYNGAVIPVMDARKNRYYCAVYTGGNRKSDYLDLTAEELAAAAEGYEKVLFTGPGCRLLEKQLDSRVETPSQTIDYFEAPAGLGAILVKLGEDRYKESGADPDDTGPMYIRLSDAELSRP